MLVRAADALAGAETAATTSSALLAVQNLVLQYKTWKHLVTATWNVTFDVQRGDRFVLLGPSGCGKSSILKSVGGFLRPVSGSITLDGRKITGPGPDRLVVFQEFEQLLPWKTVKENVMFPMRVTRRFPANEIPVRADETIRKVGLGLFVDAFPHTLSGGMKMRVAIARALAMEPAILLMDEPFAALDALARRKMQEELLGLWEQTSFTMLFVTHCIEEAIVVGSRILVLSPHPGLEPNSTPTSSALRISERQVSRHSIAGFTRCWSRSRSRWDDGGRGVFWVRRSSGSRPGRRRRTRQSRYSAPVAERLWVNAGFRRFLILLFLAAAWELYGIHTANSLLFPRFSETLMAFWDNVAHGPLLSRTVYSLWVLLIAYAAGILLAGLLVTVAVSSAIGLDLLILLTAMFNPLPAIALLPLALLWFGLNQISLVFVIVHSVLWAVALNALTGFTAVNETLRMCGKNYASSEESVGDVRLRQSAKCVIQCSAPPRAPAASDGSSTRIAISSKHRPFSPVCLS